MKTLASTCVAAVLIGGCLASASTVGYWRMEGKAGAQLGTGVVPDSSGNGVNATGNPAEYDGMLQFDSNVPYHTIYDPVSGKSYSDTSSMYFNANKDADTGVYSADVLLTDHSDLMDAKAWTFEFFFNMSKNTGQWVRWMQYGDPTSNGEFAWAYTTDWNTNQLGPKFQYRLSDGSRLSARQSAPNLGAADMIGAWHHYAVTWDSDTRQLKTYLDYQLTDTFDLPDTGDGTAVPAYNDDGPGQLAIGGQIKLEYTGRNIGLNGLVDEVRFSDAALTPGQFLVPEPTTMALLGLGGLALLRRRRA